MSLVLDASLTMAWCFESEANEYTDGILARMEQAGLRFRRGTRFPQIKPGFGLSLFAMSTPAASVPFFQRDMARARTVSVQSASMPFFNSVKPFEAVFSSKIN